jgi:hypothetical protein
MADELIFFTRDESRAMSVLDAFAERTGLTPEPIAGGVRFALQGGDHSVKVVETLNDIDAQWSRHIALGEPGSAEA